MVSKIPRYATARLQEMADWLRVVIVNGPRQSGKTTLLKEFHRKRGGSYRSLDDDTTLNEVAADLSTFVGTPARPFCIDEVQRGGDRLIRAVKMAVDDDNTRGQFVLSGSAQFLTIPTVSESLAGRAGVLELWPLSMAERTGGNNDFCAKVFQDPTLLLGADSTWDRNSYIDIATQGGYPEILSIANPTGQAHWYEGYLSTIITRDIQDFAQLSQAGAIPKLLRLLVARAGSPLILTDVARSLELDRATVRNYLSYLGMVFLTADVPAWSTNLNSKVAKTPRTFLTDSGLANYLLGSSPDALGQPGNPHLGGLIETFVFTELLKQRATTAQRFEINHYRDRDGREIDFVLETPDGRIVAIEVKASASPPRNSDRHLRWLGEKLGKRFATGIVLHLGPHTGSLGDNIYTLPLSSLWGHAQLSS